MELVRSQFAQTFELALEFEFVEGFQFVFKYG
jgi:hypothetical protein